MKRKNPAASAKARDEQRIKELNAKKPKQKKVRQKRSVPKTVQKTLPYQKIVDDYIFRIDDNRFSKTYRFEDINYSIAKQEEQEAIFLGYCSVLNSFDTSADIQVTVYNNRVNKAKFNDMVLLKHKNKYNKTIMLRCSQKMQRRGCKKPKEAVISRRQFRRKTG